jgi:chromosome segregation protein
VVPEARRAEADQARVKADGRQGAVNDLESRMADLRHIEADLETIRQAHYAAGDQVNQAQGKLYEASAEVGRLEAEIRFVVEGRQRVEQRLVQLKEQAAQWAGAPGRRGRAGKPGRAGVPRPGKGRAAGRPGRRAGAGALPDLEEALRQAQARANEQRTSVVQVQQQIQVLAAEQRSIEEQSRQLDARRERLAPTATPWPRPTKPACSTCKPAGHRAGDAAETADARLHELQDQCPSWTTTAAPASRRSTPKRAPGRLSARMEALKALQEKVKTDGKLQALAGQARAGRPAGPVEPHPHRAGLGKRAGSRAARAPGRAGSLAPGHGARLCGRCARRPSWPSTARRRRVRRPQPRHACRAWPICCA